ncbi:MAG: PTS sugar transporter subunit IIA [Breznakia sp.]
MLKKEHILVKEQVRCWEDSIRMAASTLLKENIITKLYIEKMIENVYNLGPYIIVSPEVAIPHARHCDGVNAPAISILKLQKKVMFDEASNKSAKLIIVLASTSGDTHMQLLKYVSNILSNSCRYTRLLESEDIDTIYNIFKEEV